MNRHYQKQHIKKEYAAARKAGAQTASTATKSTGKTFREKASDKVKEFFSKNKKVFVWLGAGLMLLILLSAGISSCTAMFTSTTSSVIATSYLSEDDAMQGAEAQYCQMEAELQEYLDTYESTHDYDEYHFDLDTIEHDPYVLISILTAFNEGEFTLEEVQELLQTLFDRQYILTEDVEVEVRYRTETRTDREGNEYDVKVPYKKLGEYENLDKLNYLASRLDELSTSELEHFVAIMDSGCDEVSDLDDLINLTYGILS